MCAMTDSDPTSDTKLHKKNGAMFTHDDNKNKI